MISAFSAGLWTFSVPHSKVPQLISEFTPRVVFVVWESLRAEEAEYLKHKSLIKIPASKRAESKWATAHQWNKSARPRGEKRNERRELRVHQRRGERAKRWISQQEYLIPASIKSQRKEDDRIDFSPCSCISISHPFMRNRGNQRINLTRQATFDLSKSAAISFSASSFIICQLYPFLHLICLRPF